MSRALDLLTDACVGLPATVRKMFGGHGFFAPNGGMFAGIVTDDEIMLKLVLGPARDELISLGGHPWVYRARDRSMTMAEWIIVPDGFYDDQEQLTAWAQRALEQVPAKGTKRPAKKQPPATASKPKPKTRAKAKTRVRSSAKR